MRSFAGADVNKADDYGRTPLHVAASADYSQMVRFLIENGANVHARTVGEDQTSLYYAAKNEAVQCVKILLAYGADIDARDYKLRTPLQVGLVISIQSPFFALRSYTIEQNNRPECGNVIDGKKNKGGLDP